MKQFQQLAVSIIILLQKLQLKYQRCNFQHVKYKKTPNGIDTLTSMDGSDIDEVLNWKPKGHLNSVEFWSIVARKLMRTRQIYLDPVYDSDGQLIDLLLADDDIDANETVNIVSPFRQFKHFNFRCYAEFNCN